MDFNLREWRADDAQSVAGYADNIKIAANLRDAFPHPYTLQNARDFIAACLAADAGRKCFRAIDVKGEAVGSIGVFAGDDVYRKSAEIGYWLAEPYWGNGIVTEAIRRICADVFSRGDIVRIHAEPFSCNTGSRRALEKAGFTLEGVLKDSVFKNGRLMDSCMYALLKEEL